MRILVRKQIEGMAKVGEIQKGGTTFEIYVNTNDAGKIPHFHMRDVADWSNFHTCIRVDKPEYFLHGEKTDILNTKQRKELQLFMTSPCKSKLFHEDGSRFNNWELVCMLWDQNNSDVEISEDINQPDYRLLSVVADI